MHGEVWVLWLAGTRPYSRTNVCWESLLPSPGHTHTHTHTHTQVSAARGPRKEFYKLQKRKVSRRIGIFLWVAAVASNSNDVLMADADAAALPAVNASSSAASTASSESAAGDARR